MAWNNAFRVVYRRRDKRREAQRAEAAVYSGNRSRTVFYREVGREKGRRLQEDCASADTLSDVKIWLRIGDQRLFGVCLAVNAASSRTGDHISYYQKIGNLVETLDDWQIDDLPETWGLCCLGEVCDYGNCTNVDTKDISDTAWILDLEDIEKDTGKVLQKFTKKERSSASTKHLFYKGQVLYSKLRPYLNKVVLADNDGYCTSEILPLDFNACIFPEYAKYYLMSPTFLRYANHCSYGVKMPRLGTQDGKKAVLTVPPINEQKRIANKISQLFSMLDSIEENIN